MMPGLQAQGDITSLLTSSKAPRKPESVHTDSITQATCPKLSNI